jgi:DNA-directed RNA polymerase specialized sigma subunit
MENQKTDEEVEQAYNVARKLARYVMRRTAGCRQLVSFEDFVQDGMLGWLEGKDMFFAMIDAFRKQAMMSNYSYKKKGMKEPGLTSFDEMMHSTEVENPTHEWDKQIDAQKVLKRIQGITDEATKFALLGYLYFGMSLREIAEILERSHEWVRLYLIEPELSKIREEFQ